MNEECPGGRRPVRALLFDLGNVVIDLDFEKAFEIWALLSGCDREAVGERFSMDELYEQHERGEIPAARYFAGLRRSLGLRLTDEELTEGWNGIYLGPTPGMSEVLTAAQRQLPLFAFTNSNPTHQAVWQRLFAKELLPFEKIFVSSESGVRKPDPEAFVFGARRMGFEPGEVLFFDDTAANIEGALEAGMRAVAVGSTADVRRALEGIGLELDS